MCRYCLRDHTPNAGCWCSEHEVDGLVSMHQERCQGCKASQEHKNPHFLIPCRGCGSIVDLCRFCFSVPSACLVCRRQHTDLCYRRRAWDGSLYSYLSFVEYYGKPLGHDLWEKALSSSANESLEIHSPDGAGHLSSDRTAFVECGFEKPPSSTLPGKLPYMGIRFCSFSIAAAVYILLQLPCAPTHIGFYSFLDAIFVLHPYVRRYFARICYLPGHLLRLQHPSRERSCNFVLGLCQTFARYSIPFLIFRSYLLQSELAAVRTPRPWKSLLSNTTPRVLGGTLHCPLLD